MLKNTQKIRENNFFFEKSTFFESFFQQKGFKRDSGMTKKISKTLDSQTHIKQFNSFFNLRALFSAFVQG